MTVGPNRIIKPGFSDEEIAQQIAAFRKAGGVPQEIPAGHCAATELSLDQISANEAERKRQKAAARAAKGGRK